MTGLPFRRLRQRPADRSPACRAGARDELVTEAALVMRVCFRQKLLRDLLTRRNVRGEADLAARSVRFGDAKG